jgi:hypothetical protein
MQLSQVQIQLSDKQKKGLLIGLAVVLLLVAVVLIVRKRRKAKAAATPAQFSPVVETSGNEAQPSGNVAEAKEVALPSDAFPLQRGSRGKRVEQLQLLLIKKYGAKFPLHGTDGKWGAETENNVQKFLQVSQVDEKLFTTNLRAQDYKTFKYA